ncbi:MAG TPA: PKD domain-containing protein [Candidatus Nanoarchaeia archaeon]|nr:PKD domain-containing protein [Candidatus Nanoarchaeia archaeon]
MNFKTKSLVVLMILSMFLLSSCEVYNTLYSPTGNTVSSEGKTKDTGPQAAEKVWRIEGDDAKNPEFLNQEVYASKDYVAHDPLKLSENPLGPYDAGKSLGFTLEQWLMGEGNGKYSVKDGKATLSLEFSNLVPDGVYTLWCSKLILPPEYKMEVMPCGKADGSQNSFTADNKGSAKFSVEMAPLASSTEKSISLVGLAYQSDGKTHGAEPGEFGMDTHTQLAFLLPKEKKDVESFDVDVKMEDHIALGFPEQDVFVEKETEEAPDEEVEETVPDEKENEGAMPSEDKTDEAPSGDVNEETETQTEVPEETPNDEVKVPQEVIKSDEKPVVVVVSETEKVELQTKAEDPDQDNKIGFTFTSPLDQNGQWQTTYGDAGEYTVSVTASDGESATQRDVLIIVNKKEEAPAIDSAKPLETGLKIQETESLKFSLSASDLNKDPLSYSWKLDGKEAGTESEYTYSSTYDDAGTHTVKADVTDGISVASKIWSVEVDNVNRKPVLENVNDISAKETDKIVITALATDEDRDKLTYSISDSRFKQEDNVFTWQTDYSSAGAYDVIVSVSDGQDTTSKAFKVMVENVNRPPVITDIVQKK